MKWSKFKEGVDLLIDADILDDVSWGLAEHEEIHLNVTSDQIKKNSLIGMKLEQLGFVILDSDSWGAYVSC